MMHQKLKSSIDFSHFSICFSYSTIAFKYSNDTILPEILWGPGNPCSGCRGVRARDV